MGRCTGFQGTSAGAGLQSDSPRRVEGHHASRPQRVHLLGRECQARGDPRTPYTSDPGGAGGRSASTLLLAGVHAPRAHRPMRAVVTSHGGAGDVTRCCAAGARDPLRSPRRAWPGSPTLCEGWCTADLAAHLVARERRPDSGPGIVWPPLAGYTDKVPTAVRDRTPWESLVETVRRGPPLLLRPFDGPMNTVKFFIHKEDVRRAQEGWEPRTISPELGDALSARVGPGGMAKKVPATIVITSPGRTDKERGTGPRRSWPATRASSSCSVQVDSGRPGSTSAVTHHSLLSSATHRLVSDPVEVLATVPVTRRVRRDDTVRRDDRQNVRLVSPDC